MAYNAVSFLQSNENKVKQTGSSFLSENTLSYVDNQRQRNLELEQWDQEHQSQNNGGFLGGIGYALEKIGLGFLSGIEGIWDYTAGGLAKLFGADDWAEQQFANDWVNYNHADEWYNPSDGWKVVGDVAGGIGTSLPAIAGVAAAGAITVASGGTLSPVAAGLISASIAGLGAAGRATKEAYDQTGELGGKEFGYGALVGLTEGTVEELSAGIGAGTGAVIKNITKSFGKEVAKSTARQTFTKTIFKSFAGEAFEEGLSEMLTPVWKRLTYDPNAKNATFQEIGYAALVGGLSGALMGGFDVSVRNVGSYTRGNTIVNQSKADGVLSTAQQISEYETNNHTGYESFEAVQSLYNELQNSLTKTNGQVSTARQKMLIGMLERANTSATFTPFVARSAENIVNNAELIAARLSSYGYTDANGNPITVTAEQIRSGIDLTSKSKRKLNKSFSKALKNNDILRTLAVADATGQLTMDTAKFREATLMGQRLSSQADLNRFIETATDSELRAVSERLGINDWQTITNEEFKNKITEFVENGGVETYRQERLIIRDAQNISPENAQRLGRVVRLTQDGTYRFRSANADIAIVKNGDVYRIFDYESGRLSNELTRAELNRVIREINNQNEQAASTIKEQLEQREQQENRYKIQAQEIDAFARENIKDYAKLNESNKSMVRAVIRQARASGIAEADVLSYARVSARSGLNIIFSKHLSFVAADGSFADGAIDLKNNRIIINPEAKNRTSEMILIHELTHAIYNKNGVLQVADGLNYMTDTEKERIRQRYSKIGRGNSIQISDEINAHFAEQTLSNKNILERLVADKPTIKDKVLGFFKKSTTDYSEDSKLTGAAKKLYKQYKKLFDDFVAHNQGRNATETSYTIESDKKFTLQKQESISNETSKAASVDNYTENQYNKFGWIRVNNALTKNQWNDFNRKFAAAKNKTNTFNKTVNGEQIIPVNDMVGESFGVDNVLVFAKGTYQNPTITKIIKIDLTDETSIDYVRRYIYERESNINNTQGNLAQDYFGEELIREVRQRDFPSYQEHKDNKRAQRGRVDSPKDIESNKSNQQRRRDNSNSKNNIRYALPETDSNGNTLTDKQREYFSNSKVVDENGNLLVVYHGTPNEKFYTFDSNKLSRETRKSQIGQGFYFTDSRKAAMHYTKNEDIFTGKFIPARNSALFEVYLNIAKPLYLNDSIKQFNREQLTEIFMSGDYDWFYSNWIPFELNGKELSLNNHKTYTREQLEQMAKSEKVNKWLDYHYFNRELYEADKNILSETVRAYKDQELLFNTVKKVLNIDGIIYEARGIKQFVVFDSNQIKETTNIRPTLNNDIRYALDNSKDAKDLVAIHNTSEAKLLQSIELGGLAMPSIAIVRSDIGHEGFGNISLILKSDAIDPQKNYDNKVYSADAYSPRFPQIAYSFNGKELRALADKMDTSVSMLEANDFAEGNTRERMIDNLKNNEYFIKHYLKEFGIKAEIVYKPAEYSNTIYLKEDVKNFLLKDYSFEELMNSDKVQQELQNAVDKAKEKETREFKKNILQHSYEKLIRSLDDARNEKFIYDILEKDYNNDKLIAQGKAEQVVDAYETERKTKEKLNGDKQFNDYAKSSVDKVLDKKYLRNNKDYYTNSGNPRSFEALHDDYTAENAVRIMKEQGGKNSEGGNVFGFGIGEIRAALSKIYYSIEEMHQDEYRLQTITDESSKLYEECNDDLHNIASGLSERIKIGNFLEEHDIALNAIFDVISKTKTNEQAKRLIKRDYRLDITDTEITDIRKLADKVAELPVKYFEAKPERVVNFNEIVKAFVPINTNKRILDFLREQGIDVQIYSESTPTRAELIKTLSDDIRFALQTNENEDSRSIGGLSRGQRAKFVANNTHLKVYSKAEAAEVINSIIDERLVLEDKYGSLSGKSKAEVVDMLFRQLNSAKDGYRGTVALNIADYLIENTVLNDMYVYDNADAMTELTILRSYMHKVDLKSIWGEVQHKFDDKRSSIALVWGAKEGGMSPDVIAQELNERGIQIEAINEADCFFEMIEKYDSLRKDVNQKAKEVMLRDYGSEEQIETLRQQIAKDILLAYDQKGTQSKYGRLVEKYTAQIESLRRQVKETRQQNILMNNIADRAQKLKDLKLGTFLNATQYKNDIFKNSIERLANIKYRGNFNATGTRRIMSELRQWYTKDNPVLADNFNEDIAYMIDSLSQGNNNYSTEELGMLRNVMSYFINLVENYNKVYRQGKWIDAIPEAERYIEVLHRNKDVKLGIFNRLTSSTYYQTFGDPMAVARRMDMYENGFYTEMMSELRDAAVDAEIAEMEVKTPYKNFLDTHKRYLREIENTLVTYQGVEIPKAHLISLYMTLKREQAQAGLAQNGFSFIDNKRRKVRVNGFAPDVTTDAELLTSVVEEQAKIDKLLSNTDREYIAILEAGYNQEAKKLKADRDMQRFGFTNATEDYYYPIRRGNIARNIDTSDIASELDRVSNASFNKDTVRGAKQELYIESADVVYNRHIKAVTKYAYLSPAIENYNRLYNVDISGNRNKPVSVATESANTWDRGNKYFSKLISDIQGIPSSSSEGMKLLGFIRGSYAKFQLGANPKTWVTQLSSLFASTSILDTNSVIRGLTISGKDVDTYCSLAKLRNADNTAAMAQGLLDKVGKVSNALMAPIGKMDRFVIRKLFGACQVQVEKNGGAKVGTVANKTEAGKLLRRVILETQQNSIVTERSAAMRSGNEVLRTVTMFSADSMKAMARLVDSVGELTTLRAKLRATTDVELQNTLRKQIKTAQRKLRKSAMAMASTAAFMVGVAQLFNWLYNKDNDDEEDKAQALVVDFVGNLFGGLPLIRDIYTKFTEGYDIDSYSYSALNDLLNSAVDIFDLVENLVSGNSSSQEIASSIKKLSYAIGQAFGFPVRNIYNVLYGLTKRISPATAYKIDNTFYNKSYISDLNAAIENDDAAMITTIMSILLNERIGGEISNELREKLHTLYAAGYTVLPRAVGTSLTYNNESFAITSSQRESFKKTYSQANKYIEKMIADRSFGRLTLEQQAKAIKQIYDAYYSKALSETLGVNATNNIYNYSQYIPINKLSIALAGIADIEADKSVKGTTITGSKKKKIIKYLLGLNLTDEQRLLILLLQGYTVQDKEYRNYTEEQAKNKLLKFILNMKVSQSEKTTLLNKLGYEVRNGRVIINSK